MIKFLIFLIIVDVIATGVVIFYLRIQLKDLQDRHDELDRLLAKLILERREAKYIVGIDPYKADPPYGSYYRGYHINISGSNDKWSWDIKNPVNKNYGTCGGMLPTSQEAIKAAREFIDNLLPPS